MEHLCGTCEYICTVDNSITLTFHSVSAPFYTEQFDCSTVRSVFSMFYGTKQEWLYDV